MIQYAIDVSMTVRERPTGIARQIYETLKYLDASGRGNEFVVVVSKRAKVEKLPPLKNIRVVTFGFGREIFWQQTFFPLYAALHGLTPLSFANTAPLWNVGVPSILDITYKTYAKAYKSFRGKLSMYYHRFEYVWCAHFARRVLTLATFTGDEFSRVYGFPRDRIYTLFSGWDHILTFDDDENVFTRFPQIRRGNYYFVLGNLFEYKNIDLALRTAARFPETQWVITGTTMKTSSYATEKRDNVIWTGYLSNGEVKTLIKNAKALYFPSLSEGFGIPPLEALALGTPAIVSRVSCMPCIYKNYVHWIDDPRAVDPPNPDELLKTPVDDPAPLLAACSWTRIGEVLLDALDRRKIAVFVPRPIGTGGVGVCLRNYLRHLDTTRYTLDFFVPEEAPDSVIREIAAHGGSVTRIPGVGNLPRYLFTVYRLLRKGRYDIVHANMNTLSVFPLFAAFLARVPMRINHAHSASHPSERLRHVVKLVLAPFSRLFATHLATCSQPAAKFQFGQKTASLGRVTFIPNAIELKNYAFDSEARSRIRREYALDGCFVIGAVGRLVPQKNPLFLVRAFAALTAREPNARLMFVGEGPLHAETLTLAKELGVGDKIVFAGEHVRAEGFYNAFDAFCMPSIYEGLGIVLIEAQACGLKCVTSTEVPREANAAERVTFLPLAEAVDAWADALCAARVPSEERAAASATASAALEKRGYGIAASAARLDALYTRGYVSS